MKECSGWNSVECAQNHKCSKQCWVHVASALKDLLDNTVTLDTEIGEFESSDGKNKDLIVIGTELYGTCSCKVMTKDMDKVIKIVDITNDDAIREAMGVIRNCVTVEQYLKYDSKIKEMRNSKRVALPFGKDTKFDVVDDRGKTYKGKLNHYTWKIDSEGSLKGTIYIYVYGSNRIIKKKISDYGTEVVVDSPLIKNNDIKDVISINELGYFDPIRIDSVDNSCSLIVDNKYIYYKCKGETMIIGEWCSGKMITYEGSSIDDSIANFFKKYYDIINMHHKYMMPYMIRKTNNVTAQG